MEYTDLNSPLHFMNACKQCVVAIDDGVESFINHLTDEHAIPTEWPSDRASRLTGDEAKKPYTTIAATRKKRRKLTTPRPLNSFMASIFAQHIRRNVLAIFETASSSNISRLLGQAWSKIPREIRAAYDEEASRLSKIHNKEFPTYKYQPRQRHAQCCNGTAVSPRVDMDIDEDYDNDLSLPTQVPPHTSSMSANPVLSSSARLSISIPNSGQLSSSTVEPRLPSPLKLKPEPPSPSSTNSSSPFLSSSNSSNFKLKLSIPDIRPPRLAKQPSKFLKIAPAKISPKLPAAGADAQNSRSSPCLSTSSPPSRTPSPAQQLTPNHENTVPPTVSSSSIVQNTEVTSAQQRTAETLATLHKLLNQATAQQQQNQQQAQLQNQLQQHLQQQFETGGREQNVSASASSKPCILLTPLQSEIGQQAIISCTQSATVPTLLTCGNTIYVALTVMHAPVVQNPILIRSQDNQAVEVSTSPQRQLVANQTPLFGSDLMGLLRAMDATQAQSNTECRLTELLQAALTAAALPTATTSQ
ncbi:unnamed protein product [Rodentolepis nana]|uniref:HMG box domain-containing protein n=1 Tax=Rodentolepis nana TaxID=102285 RepID=A0A0R3T7G5_RODNA|nr:unnamed protein product [Rodentolepis nana]